MPFLIALIAATTAILNTVQAGANASLNKALGQPIRSALIVTGTNALACLPAVPFLRTGWFGRGRRAGVP